MKKLTAGILTVMLGIVSANSADAAVASKGYVDAKAKANADAIAQEVTDRGTAITNLSNTFTTEIGKKVAQSDYNTKVQELENADTNISNLVGTIPETATASTIVGYIQEKTSGIATEGAMNELSGRVTQAETDIDNLESKVGNQTVAEQIAGYVTGLDLANTYDAKGSAATAEQNAKDYAKDYADGLAGNYDAKGSAATAEQNAKDYADGLAVNYDAVGSAAAAQAAAIAAAKTETETQIEALALEAISQVPAECSNMTKYCVLTYGTNGFVWEVIERAEGETGGSSEDTL